MIEADFAHIIGNGKKWKLTGLQVVAIYKLVWRSGESQTAIGRKFGIDGSVVNVIKRKET